MQRLIIMRHAKTERWFEGVNDAARALTERGKSDALRIADELTSRDWIPDHVMISTARRTIETWTRIKPICPDATIIKRDELYLASCTTLIEAIEEAGTDGTVMVIGHNPGLHELALHYWALDLRAEMPAGAEILSFKLPTAAVVLFEFSQDASGNKAVTLSNMILPGSGSEE